MNEYIGVLGPTSYPIKRIFRKLMIIVQMASYIPNGLRIKLLKIGGVNLGQNCFIGSEVCFDGIHPELVEIGSHTKITTGTKILTHFFNPNDCKMYVGRVKIGSNVFIGINSLIVNPITIGDGAVIAAGSVVNKDVPAWEIWGGVPARFIKRRHSSERDIKQ